MATGRETPAGARRRDRHGTGRPLSLQKVRFPADTLVLDFWLPARWEGKVVLSQPTHLCDGS